MNRTVLAISNHGTMLGGGEYSFLDLLTHLPPPWKTYAVVPAHGELKRRLAAKGIETAVIPLPPIRPWNIIENIGSLKALARMCRTSHPCLLYCNGSRAAFYGGITGRLLGLPSLWHCRIAEPDPLLDLFLVGLNRRIVANSHASARRFRSYAKGKVSVIYNGIDPQCFDKDVPKRPGALENVWKVILMISRVSKWKRHDIALEGFEKIASVEPSAHLFFIGARDERETDWWHYLREKSRTSPYSARIHWIGPVEDMHPWYRSADILILTSEKEPFGRVLVEAMMCGVPVVATRSGGVPEIVRNGIDGILVEPGSADEVAGAVLRILRNKTLRSTLVRSARERAKLFSLDTHVRRMVGLFEEVVTP
ncbi:MAG: glycosyltransferase family 4 protein [Deltaproteobacteria bacterium]|nr:glycosyltransferase family 4 protein [Deltaproteobacteria bacterium]MBW2066211.1 glycosyltransferase family 4 protein [Deltaproteobacteria bacterium]